MTITVCVETLRTLVNKCDTIGSSAAHFSTDGNEAVLEVKVIKHDCSTGHRSKIAN